MEKPVMAELLPIVFLLGISTGLLWLIDDKLVDVLALLRDIRDELKNP